MNLHGRHKTLDKHVKQSVAWLKQQPGVAKIIVGFSYACRHRYAPGVLRWRLDVPGGFKINAYSGKGVTDLFVKVEPIERVSDVKTLLAEKYT